MIDSLAMDVGEGCISSLAKIFCLSRQTIRKAIKLSIGQITYKPILETRGRKKLIEIFPEIKQDIENIISTYLSIKPELKDETLYVKLSIKEIKSKLIETVEICLNFMKNLTWKGVQSVTKLKEVKYEKGLTIAKKEMKMLEEQHIIRTKHIKKWSVLITP